MGIANCAKSKLSDPAHGTLGLQLDCDGRAHCTHGRRLNQSIVIKPSLVRGIKSRANAGN